jgi:hypothetical protein
MEHRKTEVLGEKPVQVPLCPPQIPHGPTRDRNRASAVRGLATNRLGYGTASDWTLHTDYFVGFLRALSIKFSPQIFFLGAFAKL